MDVGAGVELNFGVCGSVVAGDIDYVTATPFAAYMEDYAFQEEFEKLREETSFLRSVRFSDQEIEPVEVANAAYQPSGRESPRSALVLVLSVLLGGMIGVFTAFVARFISSMQQYSRTA